MAVHPAGGVRQPLLQGGGQQARHLSVPPGPAGHGVHLAPDQLVTHLGEDLEAQVLLDGQRPLLVLGRRPHLPSVPRIQPRITDPSRKQGRPPLEKRGGRRREKEGQLTLRRRLRRRPRTSGSPIHSTSGVSVGPTCPDRSNELSRWNARFTSTHSPLSPVRLATASSTTFGATKYATIATAVCISSAPSAAPMSSARPADTIDPPTADPRPLHDAACPRIAARVASATAARASTTTTAAIPSSTDATSFAASTRARRGVAVKVVSTVRCVHSLAMESTPST